MLAHHILSNNEATVLSEDITSQFKHKNGINSNSLVFRKFARGPLNLRILGGPWVNACIAGMRFNVLNHKIQRDSNEEMYFKSD